MMTTWMRMISVRLYLALVLLFGLASGAAADRPDPRSFDVWLGELRTEALSRGIRAATLDEAFKGLVPIGRVIELDRRQPEFTQTFRGYMASRITQARIEKGRALLDKHRSLLEKISSKYGVPPRFIVAFWGLETNYGSTFGSFSAIGALATLAHDPRRSDLFRKHLFSFLELVDKGDVPLEAKASWAGALGHFQFMPASYQYYAVDFDEDGKRDLWGSLPDAFASAANYLSRAGWDDTKTWGREVLLPETFDWNLTGPKGYKPLATWQTLGVRRLDGRDLPNVKIKGSILLPSGYKGPAFMVYENYRVIMRWNWSSFYAISVGHLADRLGGLGKLSDSHFQQETPLSHNDIVDLQRLLNAHGFHAGKPDGLLMSKTREAVRAFQRKALLPADGYVDMELLERLRGILLDR